ncbi:MAG TPA: hypothetical protein VMU34_18070, partial [Mycobacterium sp.]|nr:hypothetical protein [Mycobacterium sp.]
MSTGTAGELPAAELASAANRFEIAVVITLTGFRRAALVDAVGCWFFVAKALTCDAAVVLEANGVTAAAAPGSDNASATRGGAVALECFPVSMVLAAAGVAVADDAKPADRVGLADGV